MFPQLWFLPTTKKFYINLMKHLSFDTWAGATRVNPSRMSLLLQRNSMNTHLIPALPSLFFSTCSGSTFSALSASYATGTRGLFIIQLFGPFLLSRCIPPILLDNNAFCCVFDSWVHLCFYTALPFLYTNSLLASNPILRP